MSKLKGLFKVLIPVRFRYGLKIFIRKIPYYGHKFYCPVCQSKTRIQKPLGFNFPVIKEKQIVGAGVRLAMCPICESSDRIRLLFLFFKYKTDLFKKPQKLLHFAPEPALEEIFKQQSHIDYLTADLYRENVMEKIDITSISHPENSFDAIVCNHVLEHIPDDTRAMHELYRVLKPGGWAILQVPFSKILDTTFEDPSIITEKERELTFGQKDHVRIYGKDYPDKLRKSGFKVQEYQWTKGSEPEFQDPRLNLNPDEIVIYCTK